ncbi:hypothetical protein LM596_07455 [Liquorilactobacillus mali]|nr:hypothetical protein LMA_06416 [Liquorilactobacillus mali KCTC 3596 = DSM 20444]QFQ74965.1 hypothetical protein LM596_07455 [Liquorilactobacillus mali]
MDFIKNKDNIYNNLIISLEKDINTYGNFNCWCFFEIVGGNKIYNSYVRIRNFRLELIFLSLNHGRHEYFESMKSAELLKVLKTKKQPYSTKNKTM